jgi:acetyl esterase
MSTQDLDRSAAAVLKFVNEAKAPPFSKLSPQHARKVYNLSRKALQITPPQVAQTQNVHANTPQRSIPLRVYRGMGLDGTPQPGLIYFHGGGFVVGNLESHDILCRQIANQAKCIVIAVDYRLAPENRFPAAVQDAIAATSWIFENAKSVGVDAEKIAVGGDSAGGSLTAVVCINARDTGGPKIKLQILIYPSTDMNERPSHKSLPDGYILSEDTMRWFGEHLQHDQNDWRASPITVKNLRGLPPALIITAGYDPLLDEGEEFAINLIKQGVPVTVRRFPGQIHDFMTMGKVIPEAKEAVNEVAIALRCRL